MHAMLVANLMPLQVIRFIASRGEGGRGRLTRALLGARSLVAAHWGGAPDIRVRLGGRSIVHAASAIGHIANFVPGAACLVVYINTAAALFIRLARLLFSLGAAHLAVGISHLPRSIATGMDWVAWSDSGNPSDWSPRSSSQPKAWDLVGFLVAWTVIAGTSIGVTVT
ncbi:hypothetical protein [Cellulomonas sp. Y8]|uniref:hypothetical protein n=1 Tax=Cellulomonas sp. Y8 TaxID=2591145 RepID=UPI0011C9C3FC|nr:hypothetical protein [Cellulomonas sp. Y8]